MDEFDPKKIEMLFWASPTEVQDFLQSDHLIEVLQEIADAHHLHVDQLQLLSEEVVAVGIGARSPSLFTENIIKKLGVSTKEATNLTKEVDEKVFKVIKQNLIKEHGHQDEEDHSQLSREEILKEIEDHVSLPSKPTPTINIAPDYTLVSPLATKELEAPKKTPAPIATPTTQNSTPQITQNNPPTTPQTLPTANKPEEKTREVSVAPQSKVEISVPKNSPRLESRSTDPYREPIG